MTIQNYANHARYVKGFHFLLAALLAIGAVASLINLYLQVKANDAIIGSILITILFACGILLFWFTRRFAVAVQDRAIRAEESLRYYILTHKALDSKLTRGQVVALRFAYDDEFLVLADRAVREGLSPDEIKRSIKKWKPDHHRA
jgi:Zn-dependent protease with chaperone function